MSPGQHKIGFRRPDAHSPQSVGFNDDRPMLVITVSSVGFPSPDGSSQSCD
jgi:hypothetical protein